MIKNLEMLIKLSEIDIKISELIPLKNKSKIQLNSKIAERDKIQIKLTNVQTMLKDAKLKIYFYENDILLMNEKLKKNLLLEGKITTKKEFNAISIENSIAQEKITTANHEIEKYGKIIKNKELEEKELKTLISDINKDIDDININVSKVLYEISLDDKKFKKERNFLLENIHSKITKFYEDIHIWAKDTTVVKVQNQSCFGCFLKLNDSTYSELIINKELITCSNCGRILYI